MTSYNVGMANNFQKAAISVSHPGLRDFYKVFENHKSGLKDSQDC